MVAVVAAAVAAEVTADRRRRLQPLVGMKLKYVATAVTAVVALLDAAAAVVDAAEAVASAG